MKAIKYILHKVGMHGEFPPHQPPFSYMVAKCCREGMLKTSSLFPIELIHEI